MKTLKLTDNQYKLLIKTLKSHIEELDMSGCNDIFEEDLKIYTDQELREMIEFTYGKKYANREYKDWKVEKDADNIDGTWEDSLRSGAGMFSSAPAVWLLKTLTKKK